MRIGIIGAGFIGRAVGRLAVAAGHEAMVSNGRGPRTLSSIPSGIGCRIGTVADAIGFGEIVLVAIPFEHYRTLPAEPLRNRIVLDANNYYPARDGAVPELEARETTTSEMLQRHLAEARVVKAFNAILATDLEKPDREVAAGRRRALPIAGNDAAAKQVAHDLVVQFGFDCLDAGPLSEGWRFERAKPAYCVPLDREDLRTALAAAERDVEVPDGSWRPR